MDLLSVVWDPLLGPTPPDLSGILKERRPLTDSGSWMGATVRKDRFMGSALRETLGVFCTGVGILGRGAEGWALVDSLLTRFAVGSFSYRFWKTS